jgi:CBS domain containing-hemolysin-like protein
VEKQHEGKEQELQEQLEQLDAQAKAWQEAYSTFHALGAIVGAKRRPRWTVWAKAAVVALLVLVLAVCLAAFVPGLLTPLAFMLCGLLALGAWLLAAVHFYRKWEHPTAVEYLRLADLRFCEGKVFQPMIPPVAPIVNPMPQKSFLPRACPPRDGNPARGALT